ncbi:MULTISPECIES: hypothetical protein [Actinosynnema]|uniref:Uncharacterized protein n=1 Tax=Actinosynnema pretiosum TaxID=42197 RepID=A0A290Z4G3_9PSEU|nr:hypothetical protein [Actinosynnema pretiosum]ATE53888.1 hypothetical protein CNX65_11770 [Actinosynnema pretiosum]
MLRYSTMLLAGVLSAPAMWGAFVTGSVDPLDALIRFLITVPVAAVLLAIPRAVFRKYEPDRSIHAVVMAHAERTDLGLPGKDGAAASTRSGQSTAD